MKQLQTRGIILSRTDFGEADRIITVLTPNDGKLRLMARGVRKIKSKLAGGIELFCISDITYAPGRGEIGSLVAARLDSYFEAILHDITRVQLGYELIKILNKATEDQPEVAYFNLLQAAYRALNTPTIDADLIKLWFAARLLQIAGHSPNLQTDTLGDQLDAQIKYDFSFDAMSFQIRADGSGGMGRSTIQFLRLLFSNNEPRVLQKITGLQGLISDTQPLIGTMLATYIRI